MGIFDDIASVKAEGRGTILEPGDHLVRLVGASLGKTFDKKDNVAKIQMEIVESSHPGLTTGDRRVVIQTDKGKGGGEYLARSVKQAVCAVKGLSTRDPRVNALPNSPEAAAIGKALGAYWDQICDGATFAGVTIRVTSVPGTALDKNGIPFCDVTMEAWDGVWKPTRRAMAAPVAAPAPVPQAAPVAPPAAPQATPAMPWDAPAPTAPSGGGLAF